MKKIFRYSLEKPKNEEERLSFMRYFKKLALNEFLDLYEDNIPNIKTIEIKDGMEENRIDGICLYYIEIISF